MRIVATVDADLSRVVGILEVPADLEATLADPLAQLPDPADDLQALRTFPGSTDRGQVAFSTDAAGRIHFDATLPRRFGAIGSTRHGLFANGGWYPQILVDGAAAVLAWDVTVHLPPDATGALADQLGRDTLTWQGTGERASLAVVRRGRITPVVAQDHDVVLLTRGQPRRALVRELQRQLPLLPLSVSGVVVEAPLRRRLVRHGPGLAYVSDRALRLTPGLGSVHRRALIRGVLAAWVAPTDPWAREIAAAGIAQIHADRSAALDTDRLLGAFRWVPQVNALLSSRRTAFYTEILDRSHPGDPVRDDLMEIFDPYTPGSVVADQLDDRYGPGTARCVAEDLAFGDPPDPDCGADLAWLADWRRPYPVQDYVLEVTSDRVTVDRVAPEGAQLEALVVRLDAEERTLLMDPGPLVVAVDGPRPDRIVLDPVRHTAQTSRSGDAWPPRYDLTFAAWIDTINLGQGQLFGTGYTTLRRLYDTHNLVIGSISNSQSDRVALDVAYLRKEGPLQDGWRRPHRIRGSIGASLLNPAFAPTDGGSIALDASASWAHDTRVSSDFPLAGHRISGGVGGGVVPGTDDVWGSVSASATGILSPHPRHAVALRGSVAVARSALPHRLLTLGGSGLMRSIPALPACPSADGSTCIELASERAVGLIEYRIAAIRGASIPGILAWGSELQVAAGTEAIVARVGPDPVAAMGLTVGAFGLGDVLGAEAMGIGLTAAWPIAWSEPLDGVLQPDPIPEIYLRFAQAF